MRRHMDLFGTTEEQFGALAVAQRDYASKNPEAILREPMTIDDYMSSRYINKPLHLLDCDYPVDAGSALIFTTEERARDMAKKPVFFEAWAAGHHRRLGLQPGGGHDRILAVARRERMWSRTI